MNVFRMLLAEIGYRQLNFLLSLFAVAIAVALYVTGPILVDGYSDATRVELDSLETDVTESAKRLRDSEKMAAGELAHLEDETRKLMRDMGFNLTILHADADPIEFLDGDVPTVDLPQEFIDRLAADPTLTMVTHLVATLHGRTTLDGKEIPLVGYRPETPQAHKMSMKKKPMGYDIAPGTVHLGFALAADRKVGDPIEIDGQTFQIATIGEQKGSRKDVTVAMHLTDAQVLLDQPGRINQIMALECRCAAAALPIITRQVRSILPDTYVFRDNSRAEARRKQRDLVQKKQEAIAAGHDQSLKERKKALEETRGHRENIQQLMVTLSDIVTPLVLLASSIWVGLLALANVRQRRVEIGILRALGKGSTTIASLFLGKALVVGLIGALVGVGLAMFAAKTIGVAVLHGTPEQFAVPLVLFLTAVIGAPVLSAAASYLPTLSALVQDPATVLRDQ